MAEAKQVANIQAANGETITLSTKAILNYTTSQRFDNWRQQEVTEITADAAKVILPQFAKDTGWTVVDFGEREEAVNAQDTCWEVFGWQRSIFLGLGEGCS